MRESFKILSRRKIWFVYFFKSKDEGFEGTKQKIVDIASQTYGIFNFGAVNCKDDVEICEDYSVYSTPKVIYRKPIIYQSHNLIKNPFCKRRCEYSKNKYSIFRNLRTLDSGENLGKKCIF